MSPKNIFSKFGLLIGAIVLLTALGCKKQEEAAPATNEVNLPSAPAVSFPANALANELLANEAALSANETKEEVLVEEKKEEVEKPTEEDASLIAEAEKLTEIYGTFTNKDKEPYKNLREIKKYATTKTQAFLDEQMKKQIDSGAPFYGVTTKVLSSAMLESSGNAKKILVTVKKEEITSDKATPRTSYKMILINYVKEKEEWKVDGMYWQS